SASTTSGTVFIIPYDATRFRLGTIYTDGTATSRRIVSAETWSSTITTLEISLDFQIPIQGWTSGNKTIGDIDVNVPHFSSITKSGTQNITTLSKITGFSVTEQIPMYDST